MKIAALQAGSFTSYDEFTEKIEKSIAELVEKENPYLIAISELMHIPYFTCVKEPSHFEMAETMNGKIVRLINRLAYKHNVHILGTLFEKEEDIQTNYYNTAFLSSPTRGVVGKYRKVHLPRVDVPSMNTDEKYYFEQYGGGGTTFDKMTLDNGQTIGCLICYDRSFPEAWKCLSTQNVDIVVVSTATYGFRKDLYVAELQVRAMENNVFVLAANKTGKEVFPEGTKERHCFGLSSIINPFGEILAQATDEEWSYTAVEIDLKEIQSSKDVIDWNEERKPNVYQQYLSPRVLME